MTELPPDNEGSPEVIAVKAERDRLEPNFVAWVDGVSDIVINPDIVAPWTSAELRTAMERVIEAARTWVDEHTVNVPSDFDDEYEVHLAHEERLVAAEENLIVVVHEYDAVVKRDG